MLKNLNTYFSPKLSVEVCIKVYIVFIVLDTTLISVEHFSELEVKVYDELVLIVCKQKRKVVDFEVFEDFEEI